MTWELWIPGDPVPLARARSVRAGSFVRHYDPESNRLGKGELVRAWRGIDAEPFMRGEPVDLDLTFTFSRPKAHYRTGRYAGHLKQDAPHYKTSRPDLDNLEKLVKDALNCYAWPDDSQIVSVSKMKVYGNEPGTRIRARGLL